LGDIFLLCISVKFGILSRHQPAWQLDDVFTDATAAEIDNVYYDTH